MTLWRHALQDLLDARSVGELFTKAKVVAAQLEFDHFIYGVRLHLGSGDSHEFVMSGYPTTWRQLYEQNGYANMDPTIAHCLRSGLPLPWSDEFFSDRGACELMENARQFGLRSGITLPTHSANLQSGLLSLASDTRCENFTQNFERIANAQLFATYLHEAALKLIEKRANVDQTVFKLTQKERECLSWAAAGKSSWEISKIVASSERTVNFHIGNVIQKLSVSSRSQAVAKALASGLIQL